MPQKPSKNHSFAPFLSNGPKLPQAQRYRVVLFTFFALLRDEIVKRRRLKLKFRSGGERFERHAVGVEGGDF